MSRPLRPWGDYALRAFCCLLLFGSGHRLVSASTFAVRMREDVPALLPGTGGVEALAILLAAVLSLLPLLCGRFFLAGFLVSAFLLSGIGAYWWTLVPWDELVTQTGFPTATPPKPMDYLEVASPVVLAAFYASLAHASRLRAHLRNRGARDDEAGRAGAASFLAGAATLALCSLLAAGLWTFLGSGAMGRARFVVPSGVAAVVVTTAVLAVAYGVASGRLRGTLHLRRPSPGAAGPAGPARSPARRSPS